MTFFYWIKYLAVHNISADLIRVLMAGLRIRFTMTHCPG